MVLWRSFEWGETLPVEEPLVLVEEVIKTGLSKKNHVREMKATPPRETNQQYALEALNLHGTFLDDDAKVGYVLSRDGRLREPTIQSHTVARQAISIFGRQREERR